MDIQKILQKYGLYIAIGVALLAYYFFIYVPAHPATVVAASTPTGSVAGTGVPLGSAGPNDTIAFNKVAALIQAAQASLGDSGLLAYALSDYDSNYAPGMALASGDTINGVPTATRGLVQELWQGNLGAFCSNLGSSSATPANGHTPGQANAANALAIAANNVWMAYKAQALLTNQL